MATFYSNRNVNSVETISSVLQRKGLAVATMPGSTKKSWKDGVHSSPNTPLAEMLASNYSHNETVHQELRKIASTSLRSASHAVLEAYIALTSHVYSSFTSLLFGNSFAIDNLLSGVPVFGRTA